MSFWVSFLIIYIIFKIPILELVETQKPDSFDNVFRKNFRFHKSGTQLRASYVGTIRMASSNIQIPIVTKLNKFSNIFYAHIGLVILSINPLDNSYEVMHTIYYQKTNRINLPIFLCPAHINFPPRVFPLSFVFTEESIVPEVLRFSRPSSLVLRLLCSLQVWRSFLSP